MEKQIWSSVEIRALVHKNLQDEKAHPTSLKDAIGFLEEHYEGKGAVICEIKVDGKLLKEDEEERSADNDLGSITSIEVFFNAPEKVAEESLSKLRSYCPELTSMSEEAGFLYRNGHLADAQDLVEELIPECQEVIELFTLLMHCCTNDNWDHVVQTWRSSIDTFSQTVEEMLQAMESKDYVLLADLFEYEMPKVFSIWSELTNSIRYDSELELDETISLA